MRFSWEVGGMYWGQRGFLCGAVVKNCLQMQETQEMWVQSLSWGDSPGGGNDNPFQYSCLENSMDRWTWRVPVHGVAKSPTWLSDWAHTGGVEKKTGVGWRDLGAPVTTTRVSKSFQEAPTPLLIGPIHVLYLLKSGSVFIYLSIFTKRKIELQNGSNSTLQLLSVNGSRPQMAPHLEQALHTRTRLTRLSMLLKQLMYSQSMVYVFYNYTRGKHSLWK